jgi:NADPH-dependent glutamate synthase beta subunit-like oxidoreductase/NAD-dependent dihydropyrimidine dehydrogenase PreA subunit
MSIGGSGPVVHYESEEVGAVSQKPVEKKSRTSAIKSNIVPKDQVTAYINPKNCVNCGTCREICPADAIESQQRIICHACPICTEKPGMSPQDMDALTLTTACTTACPLGISPQGYVGLTMAGKYKEAYKLIWDKNPLLSVCASVCHHPCEDSCKRGIVVDDPINIRRIKKFLTETVEAPMEKYQRIYEEQIAVVGAGPAGLTAGHYLAKSGYGVTVFESANEAGGMLTKGIPEFRLNRKVVRRDIANLEDAGLEIRLNQRISPKMIDELRDTYDAVIIATGAPISKELMIKNYRLAGVMGAMSFMRQINHSMNPEHHLGQVFKFEGGEAVVIGGGSVAMDVARTAVRAGASKVTCVCLEAGEAVPAHPWELEEAKEEGIELIEGYSPVEYTTDMFPTISGVKFAKVSSMGKNADGKFEVVTDDTDTIVLKADWVVEAIGQASDLDWKALEGNDVFYAGDVASNKCSVVDAMASGRDAAIAADAALRGRSVKNPMEGNTLHTADVMEKIFPYNRRKNLRPKAPVTDPETRKHTFDDSENVYTEDETLLETKACLACGYQKVNPEKCLACGMCQKLCPKGDVITFVAKEASK